MGEWLTGELTYEGFPLMLRRPAALDVRALRPRFPRLVTVSHVFTKRKLNGLPDPVYNEGLFDLDLALVRGFDHGPGGVVVLVETFGGERNYYYYVAEDTDVDLILDEVTAYHPTENVTWCTRSDPDWSFIERYASEYF